MKKNLIAIVALFATCSAFAHDQTLTNSASASTAGSNSNYSTTSASGNGLSISAAGNSTSGSASAGSTVTKLPYFNTSAGLGSTAGTISGTANTASSGYAMNLSVGNATGSAGEVGNATANADASYNSLNNYVPLAVKQAGSASSISGQVAEVGANGAALSSVGSSNYFLGSGFASRTGNGLVVSGNVTDLKGSTSYATQAGLGNVLNLSNGTAAVTNVSGCFKAATTGTLGGC